MESERWCGPRIALIGWPQDFRSLWCFGIGEGGSMKKQLRYKTITRGFAVLVALITLPLVCLAQTGVQQANAGAPKSNAASNDSAAATAAAGNGAGDPASPDPGAG